MTTPDRAQPIYMGTQKVVDLADGVDPKDGVNKSQLDAAVSGLSSVYAPLASPTFTGDPKAPTPSIGDNDTSIATTAFVKAQGYAPLASPTFTGVPAGPTAANGTNTTQLATTAFVLANGSLWSRSNSTADQSFTSNTTFADLTSLTFAVGANKNYIFQGTFFISAGTGGGIKLGMTTPSSPTSFTAAGYAAGNSTASNVIAANAVSGAATLFSTAGAGWALAVIHVRGVIRNVNAGTVAFQGAQNTSNGTATVFQRGSFIEYSEIT